MTPLEKPSAILPRALAYYINVQKIQYGLFLFRDRRNGSAEYEQGENVGDDHELVKGVGQLPNEVVGEQGTKKYEHQRNDGIGNNALLTEQGNDVLLAEEVPTDDGGEGEEQQTDRDESVSNHAAKALRECRLC